VSLSEGSFWNGVLSPLIRRRASHRLAVTVSRLVQFWEPLSPLPCGAILRRPPPSTSGLGHGPFKAVARVRIPSGASPPEIRAFRRHVAFRWPSLPVVADAWPQPLVSAGRRSGKVVWRAVSSVGRAPGLHPGGRWFEPGTAHRRSKSAPAAPEHDDFDRLFSYRLAMVSRRQQSRHRRRRRFARTKFRQNP
jgi:hypothetical protein